MLTNRLAALAMRIARGYLSQARFSDIPYAQREDAMSKWLISFSTKWVRLDPKQNCHAYISQGVNLAMMCHMRGESRRWKYEGEKVAQEADRIKEEVNRYIAVREAELLAMDHRHKYSHGQGK
jgi:DNA-directed RNA polymerase specialized sigma subunit